MCGFFHSVFCFSVSDFDLIVIFITPSFFLQCRSEEMGSNGEEKKDGNDEYQDMSIVEIIDYSRNARYEEIERELEEMKRSGFLVWTLNSIYIYFF